MQLTARFLRALPLALLAVALVAPAAHAEDGEEGGLDVQLVNPENSKGSSFVVKGKTKPFPDGTEVVVSLGALSKSRNLVCMLKKAVVKDNTYSISEVWPSKRLAPVIYRVRVELDLKKQTAGVRKWIMDEYGYGAAYREVVHYKDIPLGTDEERAAFALKNLDHLDGFLGKMREHVELSRKATATPAAEQKGWRKTKKKIDRGLRKLRSEVDAYFGGYVVMLEQGLRKRILLVGTDVSDAIRAHGRNRGGVDRRLAAVDTELATLGQLIAERRPASQQDPLVPDEDE